MPPGEEAVSAAKEGKGINQIVSDLEDEFQKVKEYKLERIAKTEINSAQDFGKHESLKQNRVQYKQWITAEDERVRGTDLQDEVDHTMM